MKKLLFVIAAIISAYGVTAQNADKILWYKQPAKVFEESLVLGNGTLGASVFGGTASEKIYLNDATLWSGEPVYAEGDADKYKHLPVV